ncbi:LYPD6 protein, partial [Brachypodius atriceps]|nr:LYPD6 protein [Brachypodius atriceps]
SATPYPRGFKCFTCEKASDNYECNRWAPDVYCPRGNGSIPTHLPPVIPRKFWNDPFCVSLQWVRLRARSYSLFSSGSVCTSCCEGSICNLPLPRNASDAVFATLSPLSATAPLSPPGLATPLGLCLAL